MFKAVRRLSTFMPVPSRRQTARPATPEPIPVPAPIEEQPSAEASVENGGKTLYAGMQESSGQGVSDSAVTYTHPTEGSSSTTETAPVAAEEPVKAEAEAEVELAVPESQPPVVDDSRNAEPDVNPGVIEPNVKGQETESHTQEDSEVHEVPFRLGETGDKHDEVHEIRVDDSDAVKVAPGQDQSDPTPIPHVQISHPDPDVVVQEPEAAPSPPPAEEEPAAEADTPDYDVQSPNIHRPAHVQWAQDLTDEPDGGTEESLAHALDAENPFSDQANSIFPVMMPIPSISVESHGGYQPPPIIMPQLHTSSSSRASTPSANLNEVASRSLGAQEAHYQQPSADQGTQPGFVNIPIGYHMDNDYDESRPLLDPSVIRSDDKVIEPDVDKLIQGLFPTFSMPIPITEHTRDAAAPQFPTATTHTSKPSLPVFHALGWSEHQLPDSTCYYFNPSVSTSVDMDLRNPDLLHALSNYMSRPTPHPSSNLATGGGFFLQSLIPGEDDLVDLGQIRERRPPPPEGVELWLQHPKHRVPITSASGRQIVFEPIRVWVNHRTRSVSDEDPAAATAKGKGVEPDEDGLLEQERLETTARYWKFMESHPAHVPLPANAREEALEALTWSYTDKLMNPSRPSSGPFTPEETQELLTLLRNTDPNSPLQRTIHTRIVSKVHLRLIEWRQSKAGYKALTRQRTLSGARGQTERRGFPFRRTMLNAVMTCLCWGIPYLYLEHEAAMQYEYNSAAAAGAFQGRETRAMLFGASVSLTAAIILSASVSFLSVRGIDSSMRMAALVASLCAAASLASGFITIYRQRPFVMPPVAAPTPSTPAPSAEHADSESLIVLSTHHRSGSIILKSLPLTFLAWSLFAYVACILLYAFRGVDLDRDGHWESFEPWVTWTVVGVWAVLSVVLITLMALFKRVR